MPRLRAVTPLDEAPDTLGADDGLHLLTRAFAEQVAATTALLVVGEDDEQLAPVRASWGLRADPVGSAVKRGEGTAGRLLIGGRAGARPLESPIDDPIGDARGEAEVIATVGAPIRSSRGVVGALCAGLSRHPNAERGQLIWTAQAYAAVAGLCLDGSGLLWALLEAARRDGLTGCLNYAAVRDLVGNEIGRCERHGNKLACCFLDLDQFKRINDTRGHLEGNRTLATVATTLQHAVRDADVVGRYGGDEFVIVLPHTDRPAALVLAQRLREAIQHATHGMPSGTITASVGVAEWTPGCAADDLLDRADHALRIAKKAGGGVIAAPEAARSHHSEPSSRPPDSWRTQRSSRASLLLAIRRNLLSRSQLD